jgi:hypothetical protein
MREDPPPHFYFKFKSALRWKSKVQHDDAHALDAEALDPHPHMVAVGRLQPKEVKAGRVTLEGD